MTTAMRIEELTKKATLLKWAIAGVMETSRESAIEADQLGPLEELATEIENELRALNEEGAS